MPGPLVEPYDGTDASRGGGGGGGGGPPAASAQVAVRLDLARVLAAAGQHGPALELMQRLAAEGQMPQVGARGEVWGGGAAGFRR